MKLKKDSFLTNMNMVKLDENKALVRSAQAESIKSKEVIIREKRPQRMIKLKTRRMANEKRMREASHSNAQRPPSRSSWPSTRKAGLISANTKIRPYEMPNQIVRFP
jgi:hypothetical protein